MSVLGLTSGYTVQYGLSPQDFPQAAPSGNPWGSGHISSYIPHLVLIRIQYNSYAGHSRTSRCCRRLLPKPGHSQCWQVRGREESGSQCPGVCLMENWSSLLYKFYRVGTKNTVLRNNDRYGVISGEVQGEGGGAAGGGNNITQLYHKWTERIIK